MAADRAVTMQTTIQKILCQAGHPAAASIAPERANGRANIECSHLIISSVVPTLRSKAMSSVYREAVKLEACRNDSGAVSGELRFAITKASEYASRRFLVQLHRRTELTYFSFDPLATWRLLVTLKIPGTLLARMPATFLSAWLLTTPFRVTLPFTTVMRMGCAGSRAYLFRLGIAVNSPVNLHGGSDRPWATGDRPGCC